MDLLSSLSALPLRGLADGYVLLATLIFVRMSALFFFLPGIGERTMPVRVRLTAALALMLIILPAVAGDFKAPVTPSRIAMLLTAEAITGALLGFSIRIAIYAVQIAGVIISQSLSLSQMLGANVSFDPETPISSLLLFAAVVMAVTAGVHFEAVKMLMVSFETMPLGAFPGTGATGEWSASRAALAFSVSLSLAFPFVVLGFIYNMALGAANRAMPQLMVSFVGAPAITFAGIALLAASAPFIMNVYLDLLYNLIAEIMAAPV